MTSINNPKFDSFIHEAINKLLDNYTETFFYSEMQFNTQFIWVPKAIFNSHLFAEISEAIYLQHSMSDFEEDICFTSYPNPEHSFQPINPTTYHVKR